jgi:hypothetical protein
MLKEPPSDDELVHDEKSVREHKSGSNGETGWHGSLIDTLILT